MIARRRLLGLALTGVLTVAACGRGAPPPVAAPVAARPSFGGTDRAWLEITIAMDEELLPLLALAPARTRHPALRTLAAEVTAFHQAELTELRELHRLAGLPAENPHRGMPMPGMVTPAQVTEAAATSGPGFDRLLARHLRAHLEQGVRLADSEQTSGAEARTRDLAARGRAARDRFLNALRTVPA